MRIFKDNIIEPPKSSSHSPSRIQIVMIVFEGMLSMKIDWEKERFSEGERRRLNA
jgi:hypothetical protein